MGPQPENCSESRGVILLSNTLPAFTDEPSSRRPYSCLHPHFSKLAPMPTTPLAFQLLAGECCWVLREQETRGSSDRLYEGHQPDLFTQGYYFYGLALVDNVFMQGYYFYSLALDDDSLPTIFLPKFILHKELCR